MSTTLSTKGSHHLRRLEAGAGAGGAVVAAPVVFAVDAGGTCGLGVAAGGESVLRDSDAVGRAAADERVVGPIVWPVTGADDAGIGGVGGKPEGCAAGSGDLWGDVECPGNVECIAIGAAEDGVWTCGLDAVGDAAGIL